jgi:ribosomal protein S18 acetylase RimI-like enzyme
MSRAALLICVSYSIRPAEMPDVDFLWEMLSHASHAGLGPTELQVQPELARYVDGWGRPTDLGVVAVNDRTGERAGAAWLRLLIGDAKGYGYVDDTTPELAIAVLPAHRDRGVGGRMLAQLLDAARETFTAVSLSVRVDNPARRLYERIGFRTVTGNEVTSVTMRIVLNA